MNRSLSNRLALDFIMAALIVVEFSYQLTGNTAHELIGIAMLLLALGHGALNWKWFATLSKGSYKRLRIVNVAVNVLLLSAAAGMMVSGLFNSNLLSSLFRIEFAAVPREFHTAAAHWFLILMAIHLGLHWKMVMAEGGRLAGVAGPSRPRTLLLCLISVVTVIAGIYASFARGMLSKLTAYYSFDYWDPEESMLGFFVQYISIMGLYASVAYYLLKLSRTRNGRFKRIFMCKCSAMNE